MSEEELTREDLKDRPICFNCKFSYSDAFLEKEVPDPLMCRAESPSSPRPVHPFDKCRHFEWDDGECCKRCMFFEERSEMEGVCLAEKGERPLVNTFDRCKNYRETTCDF